MDTGVIAASQSILNHLGTVIGKKAGGKPTSINTTINTQTPIVFSSIGWYQAWNTAAPNSRGGVTFAPIEQAVQTVKVPANSKIAILQQGNVTYLVYGVSGEVPKKSSCPDFK